MSKVYYSKYLLNRLKPAPMYDPDSLTGFGGLLIGPWVLKTATEEELKQAMRDYYGLDEPTPPYKKKDE